MRNKNFIVVNTGKRKVAANELKAIISQAGKELLYGGLLLILGPDLANPKKAPFSGDEWTILLEVEHIKGFGWQGVGDEDDKWILLRREVGEDYIGDADESSFAFNKVGKKSM